MPGSKRASLSTKAGASENRSANGPGSGSTRRDPGTRQRVIEAAIRCILERGFYRASSNAIADEAGLTWGVIQYYFGTREALMLAVLDEGTRRLVEDLASADLTGETLTDRIEEYFVVLERYYGDPEYLAFIQVLLNLRHDPRTSEQTLATISSISATVNKEVDRLTARLFTGLPAKTRALRSLVYHVLRGLALSEVMLGSLPFDSSRRTKELRAQRKLVARALTLLIEERAGSPQSEDGRGLGASITMG